MDGRVAGVQMTDLPANMVQLRLLVSARGSGLLFDLRCDVREHIVAWLMRDYPQALPRTRSELSGGPLMASPPPERAERPNGAFHGAHL